jgi:hypothetical protein
MKPGGRHSTALNVDFIAPFPAGNSGSRQHSVPSGNLGISVPGNSWPWANKRLGVYSLLGASFLQAGRTP